jgi:di- and tripeptidase
MSVWGPTLGQRRESMHALRKPELATSPTSTKRTSIPTTSSTLAQSSEERSSPSDTLEMPVRTKPLYIREGGSIPSIRFLEKEFNAPAAHLPCGQASDSAHLDNERLRLVNLFNSKKIFKEVFREMGKR